MREAHLDNDTRPALPPPALNESFLCVRLWWKALHILILYVICGFITGLVLTVMQPSEYYLYLYFIDEETK